MGAFLINGYKIKMGFLDTAFFHLFGERTVPKNYWGKVWFITTLASGAIAAPILWALSHIPFFGIEMGGALFLYVAIMILYKPPCNGILPYFLGAIAAALYYYQIQFDFKIFFYHIEPYFYMTIMAASALNVLYRLFNRLVWFQYDRIIKRYQLPKPCQSELRHNYFGKDTVQEEKEFKAMPEYSNYQEAIKYQHGESNA